MKRTSQFLTDREYNYSQNRFKIVKRRVRFLWPVYILIALVSLPFLLIDPDVYTVSFGIALILFGVIGAWFFKNYSNKTKFEIQNMVYSHAGKLSSRSASIAGNYVQQYFISDYLLNIPDGFEIFFAELVDKYHGQKVSLQLAMCKQTTGDQVHFYYTPLKLEKDLCIDQAIKNHGKHFLRASTFQLYFYVSKMLFLPAIWCLICFSFAQNFDLDESIGVGFSIIGLIAFFLIFFKYFPLDNSKIEEKLRCTSHKN